MTLAEVRKLYESNYRDIPTCLEVQAVATVCIRDGKVDVRGMGHLDAFQTYTLLAQGMRFLEPILLVTLMEMPA